LIFHRITTEKFIPYLLLGLSLLLVLIMGLGSYHAALGSDPYGIVHFARDLARGSLFSDYPVYGYFKTEWGPGESYFVLHGNYLAEEGRMYCKYTIGFPLLLAASIRCFGDNSVFFFNIFTLLLFLGLYFALAREVFRDRPSSRYLAIFSLFLIFILINKLWGLAVKPVRDLSAMLFLVAGFYLEIKSLKKLPRANILCLVLGAFCLGFSGSIRLPNIMAAVPAGLFFLTRIVGRVNWKRGLAILTLAVVCFVLGITPALVQNRLTTGSIMLPPRPGVFQKVEAGNSSPALETEVKENAPSRPVKLIQGVYRSFLDFQAKSPPSPLWVGFLPTTGLDTLEYFLKLYGPALILLGLIGLVTGWKRPEIRYICLGLPLIFIVFYSMWVHLMVRYMIVAHPFLILLIAGGIGKILEIRNRRWVLWLGPLVIGVDIAVRLILNRKYGLGPTDLFALAVVIGLWLVAARESAGCSSSPRYIALAGILFALFLGRLIPYRLQARDTFQLPQARKFAANIDRIVPEGAVIFATKPVSQLISLFARSYSIRSFEFERLNVDLNDGCQRILDRGISLYLLDASGGRRDGAKYIPLLRKYFDATPVGTLAGDEYNLTEPFGKPVCTIYQITPWNRKEVKIDISGLKEAGAAYLMTINARTIWADYADRTGVEVLLNGESLDLKLKDNINYILLPARLLRYPDSVLTLLSDQPLPRQMDLMVRNVWAPYTIQFGDRARIPDYFLIDGFRRFNYQDRYYRRLLWEKPGRIQIPTVVIPDTSIIGQLDLRNGQKVPRPVGLKVMLDGEEIADLDLSRVGGWEEVRFAIPDDVVSSVESELGLFAYPREGYEIPRPDDDWWGALSLKAVIIKRWLTEAFLDTPVKGDYFVSFIIKPDPGADDCLEPYRVRVDGRVVRDGVRDELQRLFLSPDQVSVPVTELEVESAPTGCPALMESRPVVVGPEGELVIDLGGEWDWAYLEDGFYLPELFDDERTVRWTAETAALVVPLFPREGKEPVLTIHLLGGHPPAFPPESRKLDVFLDGVKIETIPLEGGERSYRCRLPSAGPAARLARLQLVTPPWEPGRYGINDQRLLGILIDRVVIEYH
jgi:hypothetical protein